MLFKVFISELLTKFKKDLIPCEAQGQNPLVMTWDDPMSNLSNVGTCKEEIPRENGELGF